MFNGKPLLLDEAIELAQLMRPGWADRLRSVRATGVPMNDGGEGGDGGEQNAAGAGAGAGEGGGGRADEKPPWEAAGEPFDPERAWRLIEGLRADAGRLRKERDESRSAIKQHEDSRKSETDRLTERATTAERDRDIAQAEAARLRIALKKGLTETQAKRLVGTTEEELEKDADELLASFKPQDGAEDLKRRPTERLRPGAAPAAARDDDTDDPAELARRVRRGW